MKEGLSADLIEFLITDFNLDMESALATLYDSDIYAKICDPASGLYYRGSLYVYTYLKNELQTGVAC